MEMRRPQSHRSADVSYPHGCRRARPIAFVREYDGRSTAPHGFRNKLMTVGFFAGRRKENITRFHLARIVAKPAHLLIEIAFRSLDWVNREKLPDAHCR
jgi:hypothetical protein